MKNLEITINRKNDSVTTFGMMHSVKGNVDGTINFYEAGINNEMEDNEIIDYFEEEYSSYYNVIVIFK